MRNPKVKPGSIIAQGSDRFCVLLADADEVLMHRIRPTPHGFYSRRVRWENFREHGYKVVRY